jgi:hypothetical protein
VVLTSTRAAACLPPGATELGSTPAADSRRITLTDDLDTAHRIDSGQTGGAGREWLSAWQYHPVPLPKATTLHLVAQVRSHLAALDLSLPANTR